MKTVFVIEEGEYSDYHVIGIYETYEDAEKIRNKFFADTRAQINEWPLNPGIEEVNQGLRPFLVIMKKNGEIQVAELRDYHIMECNSYIFFFVGVKTDERLHAEVWAKDEQHAVKIVNEKRIQLIALNQWKVGRVTI